MSYRHLYHLSDATPKKHDLSWHPKYQSKMHELPTSFPSD